MTTTYRFLPRIERVPGDPPLHRVLAALAESTADGCASRRPVLLDSASGAPRRFSLLGLDPVAEPEGESLDAVRDLVARLVAVSPAPVPPPGYPDVFAGGFLGALAYDLGVAGEDLALPAEPWGFPRLVGGLYVDFFVRDEVGGATFLVLGEEPGDARPSVVVRRAALLEACARAAELPPFEPGAATAPANLRRHTDHAAHAARIHATQEHIRAGDIYQANIAHRMTQDVAAPPVDLYRALRRANPAPYMGYLAFEGGAVLSSSPELLLELGPDKAGARVARTRPIKGTAPRGATAEDDARQARALRASAKDNAELAMIVDLARNDLGRIAEVGTVRVEELPRLESYAAVHHLTADVTARPRPECDAVHVLASLFPGGSITGAPKLRAMEIIAELEGEGRGFFTGSLGFVDTRGRAAFNILIRTLLWRPHPDAAGMGEASLRVGGGITWASDAALEDAETLDKARALAAALAAAGNSSSSGRVKADPSEALPPPRALRLLPEEG